MAQNLFPKLRGLDINVHVRHIPSTRTVLHVSGREVRESQYKYPLYEIDLIFNALSSYSVDGPLVQGLGYKSLQALKRHHLFNLGAFGAFPFRMSDASRDSTDSAVTGQLIGIGDGTTTAFTCMRQVADNTLEPPYLEPVGLVEALGFNLYVNGALQSTSTYSLTYPNKVTFNSAPAAQAQIAADYTFFYLCRYKDDTLDFEQIYKNIHRVQTLTLRTVKVP